MTFMTVMIGPSLASDAVRVGDYQIQIFTDPDPLVAETEVTLILKILHLKNLSPVRGARMIVGTGERLEDIISNGLDLNNASDYLVAEEADVFGNYQFNTTFRESGIHYIGVSISELEGEILGSPIAIGFPVSVKPSGNTNVRLWVVLLVFLLLTLMIITVISIRKNVPLSGDNTFNILDIPWVKRLFQSKFLQPALQIPLLCLALLLILLAFIDTQDSGKNLSTISIWTLWWAGVIFTFVTVGRLWCFMCPVGAVSDWVSRVAGPQRHFPEKMRNVWIANMMFVLLTWLDIQIGVVRSPVVTGSLLISIIGIAIAVSLFFQRRTFCRYLCPIGGLIGIYAMFSAVELRSKDVEACRRHKRKDCNLGSEKGYGCPMFETIPEMDSNFACNFCGECIKTCPKNNITIRTRRFFKDAWTARRRSPDEAALAIVLVGISIFVTGDMLEPWQGWIEYAMASFPAQLLGIKYAYTVEVITKSVLYFGVSLFLIPAAIAVSAALSDRLIAREHRRGIKETVIGFAYMFIPIGLSMHLAHNTSHLLKESGAIIPALQRAINTYTPFYAGAPDWGLAVKPLIDSTVIYWLQMGLFLVFYMFSLHAGYRLSIDHYRDPQVAARALLPMIGVSFVLMAVNVYLLNLPMEPRHVH